jgi:glycosyltransferase involved in cell wall biosynthesis/SAM-dependent methyltransferase
VRILHIATRHVQGGGARNLRHCIQWEMRQGYEIHALFGERGFAPALLPDGVRTTLLPELVRDIDPVLDSAAYRQLRKLIRDVRPDVVQTHHSKAGILGRLAVDRRSAPVVIHTIHMASFGKGYSRAASRIFLSAERLCSRFTDLYVAVGSDVRDQYLNSEIGEPHQYHVVRAAMDVSSFSAVRHLNRTARLKHRADFELPAETPVCLALGLLEPRKRHDLLLERIAPLLRRRECLLVVAGDGSERDRLVKLAAELSIADQVRFLGHVTEVRELLAACDLLIHTSLVEGVPQAVIQALIAGLPVVATPSTGICEAGSNGVFLIDPEGRGLPTIVRSVLEKSPSVGNDGRFAEWTETSVNRQLGQLHAAIQDLVRANVADRLPASATAGNLDQATVEGFGQQWELFDQADAPLPDLRRQFEQYFRIFPWAELPANAVGFDLGCGTGRWARFVAPRVRQLHCIDASEAALQVARANLKDQGGCTFHHASVDDLPLPHDSMDFGYSLGVLHHVPDTLTGIRSCVDRLRPGAPFLLYLYYALEQRPWWYRMIWRAADEVRLAVSRLPTRAKLFVTGCIAAAVYFPTARFAGVMEKLGFDVEGIPLSLYRRRSFYSMRTDAFDTFGTRFENRFSRDQVVRMMRLAGLQEISVSEQPPYWCAIGRKGSSSHSDKPRRRDRSRQSGATR